VILGNDHGFDIRVDEFFGNDEPLPEDIQLPVAADKPDQDDGPLGDLLDSGHPRVGRHPGGLVTGGGPYLHRGFAAQAVVSMVAVMEPLKVLALPFEGLVVREPLPAKEHLVVGIVEPLHIPVSPGFADGDKDRRDSVIEAQPDHDPEGAGVTVAAPEAQLVVELGKIRDPHSLPASQETGGYRIIGLGSLRLEMNPMTETVQHVERVEPAIPLDISGPHQVDLVDVVDLQSLRKVGVCHPFGNVRSFF